MKRIGTAVAVGSAIALAPGTAWAVTIHTCTSTQCGGTVGSYSAEPRYGSPNSIPFQAAQSALDLNQFDPDDTDIEGDADTIGGAFTYYGAGFQKGQRYELRYQHASRLGEGTRARLLIDLPIAINHVDKFGLRYQFGNTTTDPFFVGGATAVYGTLNVGVELPVKPNWLVTPRVDYSNLQAGAYFAHDAEAAGASLTSRYKIPQVGRGDLTIGNMVSYQHSIDTFLAKQPFYFRNHTWTFRNGLAYQLPLKMRMFGRQTSLRASYVATYMTGVADPAFKWTHEAGINIGVRTREAEQKNRFEQMRIGLLYTFSHNRFSNAANYNAVTLTLGYRF